MPDLLVNEEQLLETRFKARSSPLLAAGRAILEGILYLGLFISPFLFGAGFVGGYTALECASLLLGAGVLLYSSAADSFKSVRWVNSAFLLLAAWLVFLCFQHTALPVHVVRALSPRLVELLDTYGPLSLSGSVRIPPSLNTYGSFVETGKFFSYSALFLAACALIQDKKQ